MACCRTRTSVRQGGDRAKFRSRSALPSVKYRAVGHDDARNACESRSGADFSMSARSSIFRVSSGVRGMSGLSSCCGTQMMRRGGKSFGKTPALVPAPVRSRELSVMQAMLKEIDFRLQIDRMGIAAKINGVKLNGRPAPGSFSANPWSIFTGTIGA
jgi:hypothetical protein